MRRASTLSWSRYLVASFLPSNYVTSNLSDTRPGVCTPVMCRNLNKYSDYTPTMLSSRPFAARAVDRWSRRRVRAEVHRRVAVGSEANCGKRYRRPRFEWWTSGAWYAARPGPGPLTRSARAEPARLLCSGRAHSPAGPRPDPLVPSWAPPQSAGHWMPSVAGVIQLVRETPWRSGVSRPT